MKKLRQKIISAVLTISAVLVFVQYGKSQEVPGGIPGSTRPRPAWQGKAAGDVQPFEFKNDDLKTSLITHPVPDIWLAFARKQGEGQSSTTTSTDEEALIKVELPIEAKSILKSFWEKVLEDQYYETFVKVKSAHEYYDRGMAWNRYRWSIVQKLKQIEIYAPNVRRAISEDEADDLLLFAHVAAINLAKKAKEK